MSGEQIHFNIDQIQLANGLKVQAHYDPSVPGASVNLWYRVGSGEEKLGATGFAHLFEHLMFQGSSQVASGQHLGDIQNLGGDCNATTSFDRTNYFETVPPGALEYALWLEADRMASLNVSAENFQTQREVVKEEKRQRYDNAPYGDMLDLILNLNFPANHPYGHSTIGSMADLDAASLTQVNDFHDHWYRPDGAVLSVVSPIKTEIVFSLTEKYFGQISTGNSPVAPMLKPERLKPHKDVPTLRISRQVPSSILNLTWITPEVTSPDNAAVNLALDILAGKPSSRLNNLLIRELDIADAVNSGDLNLARNSSIAMITVRAKEGKSTDELAQYIVDEIKKLADFGPSTEELARAKANYEREWLTNISMGDARADQLSSYATIFGDPNAINDHLGSYLNVCTDDIARVATQILNTESHAELHYEVEK